MFIAELFIIAKRGINTNLFCCIDHIYPYNGILLSHKEKQRSDTCNMDESWKHCYERIQAQKGKYCMVPLVWNVQNQSIHRDRKKLRVFQASGREGWEGLLVGMGFHLGMMEMIQNSLVKSLHNLVNILKPTGLNIKMLNFIWIRSKKLQRIKWRNYTG